MNALVALIAQTGAERAEEMRLPLLIGMFVVVPLFIGGAWLALTLRTRANRTRAERERARRAAEPGEPPPGP